MTGPALLEVLQDRLNMLVTALDGMSFEGEGDEVAYARQRGYLEGRVEELRVCLDLAERVVHPLMAVTSTGHLRLVPDAPEWGKQDRHNWPDFAFGASEAEPGVDRYDPERC